MRRDARFEAGASKSSHSPRDSASVRELPSSTKSGSRARDDRDVVANELVGPGAWRTAPFVGSEFCSWLGTCRTAEKRVHSMSGGYRPLLLEPLAQAQPGATLGGSSAE